jgi:hypothetical protein
LFVSSGWTRSRFSMYVSLTLGTAVVRALG